MIKDVPVVVVLQAAAEALSNAESSVNRAIFDAEEMWKRMWRCGGFRKGSQAISGGCRGVGGMQ